MSPSTNEAPAEIEWMEDYGDHQTTDRASGHATGAAVKGRCTKCWGRLVGRHQDERWTSIDCRLCGTSVEGDDAASELETLRLEADRNRPTVVQGQAANYRKDAKFVLKIFPRMDRDKAHVDERIAAKLAAGRRPGWLSRSEFPNGTAGYLYLQSNAFMAGIESLPREMSVVRHSDFDFEEPRILGVDVTDDGSAHVSGEALGCFRGPSEHLLLERMGVVMMSAMTSAFACELALKAILITRRHEARKTHDLLALYNDLPQDSRSRLEADFAGIQNILEKGRHTFGHWRYFEKNAGEEGMLTMVNTERAFMLAKSARVIIDEGEIAGLAYDVNIDWESRLDKNDGNTNYQERYGLSLTGREAAIPWDALLSG